MVVEEWYFCLLALCRVAVISFVGENLEALEEDLVLCSVRLEDSTPHTLILTG